MPEVVARMAAIETRIFKSAFPSTTNHYDMLFGGTALQLMDEVASTTDTRSRKRMVTVSSDKVNFTNSIPAGTIIELVGL